MAGVPYPNTNQGISAGLVGPRFGNGRGERFDSPLGMASNTPTTAIQTNGRHTSKWVMKPTDNNWDGKWDNGTLLFVQQVPSLTHHVMSLEMLRYFMHMSAITKHINDAKLLQMGEHGSEILKANQRGRGINYGFLNDIESITESVAFIGPAFGPTTPSTSAGGLEPGHTTAFTGDFKVVAAVDWGHCYVPNFWGDLQAGQEVFMIMKPMPLQESYFSPSGDRNTVPEDMRRRKCLVTDIQFTSRRPMDICSLSELLDGAGEQPPPDSAEWIDWDYNYDNDGKVIGVNSGELKRGIVWSLGHAAHSERGRTSGVFVPSSRRAERLQWSQDYREMPQMELLLHVKRITGY